SSSTIRILPALIYLLAAPYRACVRSRSPIYGLRPAGLAFAAAHTSFNPRPQRIKKSLRSGKIFANALSAIIEVMRRFAQFAWGVLGFNLLVILWGALVRASRSGEGCGDHWPLCNGTVIPHAQEVATVIEFTHRVTTGIAFLSVVAMAVWAFRAYRKEPVWPAAAASLILIITEALLGAGLVLFKFVGTDVSGGRVVYLSAHLINTLLMLAAMALTAWWASGHRAIEWPGDMGKALGMAILGAIAIAVTGALTALSDTLFPVSSLLAGIQADFAATSPVLVKLRVLHPVIAGTVGAYIAFGMWRVDRAPGLRIATIALV